LGLSRVDAAISSRSSHTAADIWAVGTRTLTGFGTLVADVATAVWGATTRTLSAFGFSVTVGTNSDKTGYALTAGERTAIANEVEAQIIDETDSEKVLTAITDKIASVNPSLGGLTLSAIAAQVRTELAVELARIDAAISSRSTYAGADTTGTTTLLGRLTSTRAGLLDLLAHLDIDVSTRLAGDSYTAPDNTSIAAIKLKTDNLPSDPADASDIAGAFATVAAAIGALSIPTTEENATDLLDLVDGVETGVTLREALRIALSVLAGKLSGANTNTPAFRDINDTKDRLTATTDVHGNRLTVTVDAA